MLTSQLLVLPIFLGGFLFYRHLAPHPGNQRAILKFDLGVAVLLITLSVISAWLVFSHVEGGEDSIWGHVLAATCSYLIVLFGLHLAYWIRNCILFKQSAAASSE